MFSNFVLLSFIINIGSQLINHSVNQKYLDRDIKIITGIISSRIYMKHDKVTPVFNSIITLLHSSSGLHSVLFRTDEPSVACIDQNSLLCSSYCIIQMSITHLISPFICEGEIKAESMSILNVCTMRCLFSSTATPLLIFICRSKIILFQRYSCTYIKRIDKWNRYWKRDSYWMFR